MKHLIELAALSAIIVLARTAQAQDVPPPPPPPPPQAPTPETSTTEQPAATQPPAAKSPAAEPSAAAKAPETEAPSAAPAVPEKAQEDEKRMKELRARCAELKKKGEPLPDECKVADLEVVFQGAVARPTAPIGSVPQAKDTESDSLVEKPITFEEEAALPADKKVDLWALARQEPVLLADVKSRFFSAGLQVGYSWMRARGSAIEQAYDPIINLAAEIGYQLFPLFQLALVADFEVLKGHTAHDKEVVVYPASRTPYEDGSPRMSRDVGAFLDDYFGFGLRPTFRVNVELWRLQLLAGVGLGYHFFHTSGRWRTKLPAGDRANTDVGDNTLPAKFNGDDYALYSFELSDSGIYGVFEAAVLYRLLEGRLGVGVLFKYTVPVPGAVEPDVTVEQGYGVHNNPAYGMDWTGYETSEKDYGDTFIRHLGSMSFITLGLMADFRF